MLDFSSNVSVSVGKQLYESIKSDAGSGPLPVPKSYDITPRLVANCGSGPAWPRVIDASLAVATRSVSVNSKVSLTHDIWLCSQGNSTLFNVRLRTQRATDADVLVFPAHAAAADLAANCKFFERFSRPPRGAQYETSQEDALVIPIELDQMYLHAAIRSLYQGSVQLSPNNVEGVYKAASCLGMPAVIAACKEYLLTDMISKNAVTYPEASYQAALLIHRHMPAMLADLWKTCAQLDWSAPGLQQVLDRVLTPEEACGVLRQKRQQGCACEAQVLECIKGVGSKRCALLHQLVDFGAMHSLELQALMRFASALLRGASAASPTSQGAASPAGTKRRATSSYTSGVVTAVAMPHSPSAGSTCSAMSTSTAASSGDRPCEDRFWATVLAGATAAHLDACLAPQRGLHVCTELVSTIETVAAGGAAATTASLRVDDIDFQLLVSSTSGEAGEVGLLLRPRPRKVLRWAVSRPATCRLLGFCHRPDAELGEATPLVHVTGELEVPVLQQSAAGGWPGASVPGLLSRWLAMPSMRYGSKGGLDRLTIGACVVVQPPEQPAAAAAASS